MERADPGTGCATYFDDENYSDGCESRALVQDARMPTRHLSIKASAVELPSCVIMFVVTVSDHITTVVTAAFIACYVLQRIA